MINTKFCCEKCNYSTIKKQNYDKHILTKKHIDNKIEYNFWCNNCSLIPRLW